MQNFKPKSKFLKQTCFPDFLEMEFITPSSKRMYEMPQKGKECCISLNKMNGILSSLLFLFKKKLIIRYEPSMWAGFSQCVLQCIWRICIRNTVFRAMPRRGSISFQTLPLVFGRRKFQESMSVLGFFPPSPKICSHLPDWGKRRVEFLIYTL